MSSRDLHPIAGFDSADSDGSTAVAPAIAPAEPVRAERARPPPRRQPPRPLPLWHVVLLDDDDHTYEYVINMLGSVFGHPGTKAFMLAEEVDAMGRVIVFTGHRELAELKREQIIAYGADARIATSRGGMGAVIEPAE